MRSSAAAPLRHALAVVAGYSALFAWLFLQPLLHGTYMAEGDLYDWFLPIFLSPISAWSHDMFGGLPLFADTSDSQINIVHCTAWFPLMVLAVDRVITGAGSPRRWMALGAFAIANGFLAGHPQSILYEVSFCAVYALAGGVAERADRVRYLRAMGMLVLGIALTAIKA